MNWETEERIAKSLFLSTKRIWTAHLPIMSIEKEKMQHKHKNVRLEKIKINIDGIKYF